jgi:hypothetical protein
MSSQNLFFVQIRQGKREEFPAPGRNNSNIPSSLFSLPFPHLEIAIKLDFWYKEVNFRGAFTFSQRIL